MLNIVYKKELQSAEDKEKRREELKQQYADAFFTPFRAADLGFIDQIIEPNQTRIRLIETFELLENKRETTISKKHGNIPLQNISRKICHGMYAVNAYTEIFIEMRIDFQKSSSL